MYKVGLTGGIACGKSSVAELFKAYGISIIDADEIAHALVVPDSPALTHLSQQFGAVIIKPNGELNRAKLRELIFNDADKKHQLEAIMHPLIYAEIEYQLSLVTSTYCVLAIPLLIETKMQSLVNHILVVDCALETQINRVKLRDNLSDSQVMAIINSQVSRDQRLAEADSIIDNNQHISDLSLQVNLLHNQFLKQSQ